MNNLELFLALPDVENITEEIDVSERLTKIFGKFKVKAMTQEEFKEYQRKSNYKVSGKGSVDIDSSKYFASVVAGQTLYPNFCDPEILTKFGCVTGEELVGKKLLIGEIITIATKIQEISGFGSNINTEIQEAKN